MRPTATPWGEEGGDGAGEGEGEGGEGYSWKEAPCHIFFFVEVVNGSQKKLENLSPFKIVLKSVYEVFWWQ